MGTTVDINDELPRTAKKRAAGENATLREIFDRALRQCCAVSATKKFKLRWKTHKGGHIQSGLFWKTGVDRGRYRAP